MPKYFEYNDPDMYAHVARMVEMAEEAKENETKAKDCNPGSDISNKDKPFAAMSKDDVEKRYALAQGMGKDHFIVAKHRDEQKAFLEEYDRLESERDAEGNFEISLAQTANIAKVVQDRKRRELDNLGFWGKIKTAVSLSQKAREERDKMKALNRAINRGK